MSPLKYEINRDLCIKCGLCLADCPSGAIKVTDKDLYSVEHEICIGCGHCGAVCPEGAVTCDGEDLIAYNQPEISAEQAYQLFAGKRSVRQYKSDSLPQGLLEKILTLGSLTATASNSMSIRAVVFRAEEVKILTKNLSRSLLSVIDRINNPFGRYMVGLFGFKRYASSRVMNGFKEMLISGVEGTGDPLFFNAPLVICLTYPKKDKSFGRTNAALAGQSMMLFAHTQGIESCMIGFAEMAGKLKKGRKALRIPEGREAGLIFTLGYSRVKYRKLPSRLPLT